MEYFDTGTGQAPIVGRGVGPILEKFGDVSRIAVLRGGGIGDLLFAFPAVESLKQAYAGASVTLLGTPIQAALLSQTHGPFDEATIVPVSEGVRPGRPGEGSDDDELSAFFADMASRKFDLGLQLHGGGRYSNGFLQRTGARHTVGSRTPDAPPLERNLPYLYYQHEPLRSLEVAGLAGAPPAVLEPRLTALDHHIADVRERLASIDGGVGSHKVVAIHAGATDPRRRWAHTGFAEVARRAAKDRCLVVLIGDEADRPLAAEVLHAARAPHIISWAGELTLGELCALLAMSDVLIANDSGPRHLAQALGTPTVGIYWMGNVISAGPLGRAFHRIHMSWVTRCPACGVDVTQVGWTAPRCEHNDSLILGISAEDVYEDAAALMAMNLRSRGK
ncbi:glycosyltransferase family 9 protein [Arthrobacter bambusae]|uniref:glycosyltransferase family 9 protein n=1 Tax=Arthrobacter bambusae TaxID=1338426 RepID=UPI0027846241|nr:glycosyltransferase family 9 protein [Arthrobacter bambusae]MDQ0028578.1 ADP-heptose:LPS heptosyltransferase [Arthrobacter bambusae]MDQ0096628.1 ADP-heptose:LPS heptosyltransferase [Arthrobacter bambusae]